MLRWLDPTLTSYDKSLATTWKTSVDRLSPECRRLLDRLAMMAPDPIPDSLIDVVVPGETADYDAHRARAGLYAYSLIARATGEDDSAKGFVMHRLVQDFARRATPDERRGEALRETLGWIDDAFAGDPEDVRIWPVLDPLAPHTLAVARRANDRLGSESRRDACSVENSRSASERGRRFAEAEPLFRRALEIHEARYGPDHPYVATDLTNLAGLLRATNRHGEAEPLYRRALTIWEKLYALGIASRWTPALDGLAELLRAASGFGEAEPLYRRALKIDEASHGPDHPNVARDLNNLALLLQITNRHREAEPLFRRAWEARREKSYGPDQFQRWRPPSPIAPDCSASPTASARPSRFTAALDDLGKS